MPISSLTNLLFQQPKYKSVLNIVHCLTGKSVQDEGGDQISECFGSYIRMFLSSHIRTPLVCAL